MEDKLRRSGRTTRALAAAFQLAYRGGRVVFITPHADFFDYCVPILKDMGAFRVDKGHRSVALFGSGAGIITFLPYTHQDVDRPSLLVKGWEPGHTIWDHESVRRAHNHIIQRYHEYG